MALGEPGHSFLVPASSLVALQVHLRDYLQEEGREAITPGRLEPATASPAHCRQCTTCAGGREQRRELPHTTCAETRKPVRGKAKLPHGSPRPSPRLTFSLICSSCWSWRRDDSSCWGKKRTATKALLPALRLYLGLDLPLQLLSRQLLGNAACIQASLPLPAEATAVWEEAVHDEGCTAYRTFSCAASSLVRSLSRRSCSILATCTEQ